MYELKTKVNNSSVLKFINDIKDSKRREDSLKLMDIISDIISDEPKMWGTSIVGYGLIKYTNSTNKEYDWFKIGFSPRKLSLSLYLTAYSDYMYTLADELNIKHGKGCFYIKDLSKLDIDKLREMIIFTISQKK